MMVAVDEMLRFAQHDKCSGYLTAAQAFIPFRFECIRAPSR